MNFEFVLDFFFISKNTKISMHQRYKYKNFFLGKIGNIEIEFLFSDPALNFKQK